MLKFWKNWDGAQIALAIIFAVMFIILGITLFWAFQEDAHCHDLGGVMTRAGCIKKEALING